MKVLSYGSLNIDLVFRVPHIVRGGETLSSYSLMRNPGGKGGNQAVALAKAGCNVSHAGKIGKDGLFFIVHLKRYGIDTSLITVGETTGQAIIQVDDESENSIVLYAGENKNIKRDEIDEVFSHFDLGDWVVLQNEINEIPYIIRKAKEKGMKVCFNPAPMGEEVLSYPLSDVDLLVVNETEGAGITGLPVGSEYAEVVKAMREKLGCEEMLLTMGKDGALWFNKSESIYEPIHKVKVVDTTAAGDTFIGYFLSSRIRGLSIKESLEKASLASSITVSRLGAMDTIPGAEEVFGE